MSARRPKKAIVLAAGFGSRMAPLTHDLPKALLPFDGLPLLERTLRLLAGWGVRDVLVNAHHHPEQIMGFVLERAANPPAGVPPLRLQLSYEPEILGTGGALAKAAWFLDQEPTWLVNADVVAELDPAPLVRHHAKQSAKQPAKHLATLWMTEQAGPRTVRIDPRSRRVRDFRDPEPGSPGTATFCGLHLLDARILDFLPSPPAFGSIITAYRAAQQAGHHISGLTLPRARWADVGTPEQYLDALFADGRMPGRKLSTAVAEPSATVHKKADCHRTAVWPGASLAAGARARNVIVGRGTRVDGPVERIAVPATLAVAPAVLDELPVWCRKATAVCLDLRGSDRSFIRLQRGRNSAILMQHGEDRPENERFTAHSRFLARHGIDVPAVVADLPQHRCCLVEDLGADELLANPSRARLERAIDLTRALHAVAVPKNHPLERPFTPALFRWEADLFIEQFLRRHAPAAVRTPRRLTALRRELDQLGRRLARASFGNPRVLLHRDLQSTNILFHRGTAHLIDFQGMRLGPALYDVGSLLADPYMDLESDMQDHLLDRYLAGRPEKQRAAMRERFPLATAQRLIQALGAYGRLGARPATRRFLHHIPAALGQLARALENTEQLPLLREITEKTVSTRDRSGYGS